MKKTAVAKAEDKPELEDLEALRREVAQIREFIAEARRILNDATDLAQKFDMKIMGMQIKRLEGMQEGK